MDVAVKRRLSATVAAVCMAICGFPAHPASPATLPAATCRAHAPEAAVRSGLTVDVIIRVMRAESGGSASIVSLKGAIGCMQIMPATWNYLSRRYGLGNDPYAARMNMIGGAMYLAELARRFGWPGAFAAYNAGPARYIRYAANGVPLPAETVAYAARLGGGAAPAIAAITRPRWQEARLFLDRAGGAPEGGNMRARQLAAASDEAEAPSISTAAPRSEHVAPTLFPLSAIAAPDQR